MLISPHYKEMNRQLMESRGAFAASGHKWAGDVEKLATLLNTTSILDYGCGKGTLAAAIPGLPIREYDPAVRGKDEEPVPADLVICTDVMEHIEPDCLGDVLDHLQALGKKIVMFSIFVNGPANAILPDGRNAHLIQENCQWWTAKLNEHWFITQMNYLPPNLFVLAVPAPEKQ